MITATDKFAQAILETIFKVYGKCYVGHLRIHRLPDGCVDVSMGLDNPDKPLHISAQLDDQSFLAYFEQELRKRRLTSTKFFTGYKTDMYERHFAQPINHSEQHINDNDLVSDE